MFGSQHSLSTAAAETLDEGETDRATSSRVLDGLSVHSTLHSVKMAVYLPATQYLDLPMM